MSRTIYDVIFSRRAREDLVDLFSYLADRDGVQPALTYVERIETFCESLSLFPQRGSRRDDLLKGLRIVGFERRASIASTSWMDPW